MTPIHRTILFAFLLTGFALAAQGQPFAVSARLSSDQVFTGEAVQLIIQVQGTTEPELPDTSAITDFTVRYAGTQPSTSRRVVINMGKRTETVQLSAAIIYELTPKRSGALVIPPLIVKHDGEEAATGKLAVLVKDPEETDQVKLRMSLSPETCYVGEPVLVTWTLYFSANLSGLDITSPVLQDDRFSVPEYAPPIDRNRQYRRLRFRDFETIAVQDTANLDGKPYATLTFAQVLIPLVAGELKLPPSTALTEVVVGRRRSNDVFHRLVNVTKDMAVPANSPTLTVKEVPTEGRPANYAGHIGQYTVTTFADPKEVNVGDPIELSIELRGPKYLDHVECPDLAAQDSLTKDFRVSQTDDTGTIKGDKKVFTRTLRALHPDVTEIPPIELSYFDTDQGKYLVARSNPIPLEVKATKVVTAHDAEGSDEAGVIRRQTRKRATGLAANYEDSSVLRSQQAGLRGLTSPAWLSVLVGLPLVYAFLAIGVTTHRRRHADPAALASRRALRLCLADLASARSAADPHSAALDALRAYFGAKFSLTPGALTYQDLVPRLEQATVPEAERAELRALFEHCEAGRYAGGASVSAEELIGKAEELVRQIDRRIGR
jgi:hypothetical protein